MLLPLHEFDPDPVAVLDPSRWRGRAALPERGVACWFGDVVRARTAALRPAFEIPSEHGAHPIWIVEHGGEPLALCNLGVGAPLAAGNLDVMLALGCTKVIGCGGAGVIRPGIDVGHVIVPTGAVRDEGTSYHYAPADAAVAPHADALAAIVAERDAHGVPHDLGLTWTTDGLFRETRARVARRREQGCITVEMEASALFAVAAFRGAVYGQLLYAGDDVSAEQWDHRGWDKHTGVREHLLALACGAALRL